MGRRITRRPKAPSNSLPRKKQYLPPRIVEYGSAAKLSASKPGSFADGANSILMTAC